MQSAHRSTLAARAVPRATVFRALPTPAATAATVAAVVALLLAFLLVWRAAGDGVTFASFLSYTVAVLLMGAAVILAGWAVALARLRYEVTYGTLTIVWGLTRQVVPLLEIERVVRGRALGLPVVEGLALPRLPAAGAASAASRR